MVRWIGGLIGLGFVAALFFGLVGPVSDWVKNPPKESAAEYVEAQNIAANKAAGTGARLLDAHLSSAGLFGKFDKRQLQRGYQVYKEVCSACHSIRLVAFRDMTQLGYSEGQVKTLAADWTTIPSVNEDTGETTTRKGGPAEHFPLGYPNDTAARAANGGAIPPDQSDIVKAREDGANYIYSLVGHGYEPQPAALLTKFPDVKSPKGRYYNKYFGNLNIAMPPPLRQDGQVQYQDGTKPTVDQMAKDVAAFLTWSAYQNVWRDVRH